jgi:hypothetical protein
MTKKVIEVELFCDKEFKDSFWHFDLERETRKALDEFEKQFPCVEFLINKISLWDSPGNDNICLYLNHGVFRVMFGGNGDEAARGLIKKIKTEAGLKIPAEDALIFEMKVGPLIDTACDRKRTPYICGLIDREVTELIKTIIFKAFRIDFSNKEVITIAFTGKIISDCLSDDDFDFKGVTSIEQRSILMCLSTPCATPPHLVILHELGHVFGAIHPPDEFEGDTVMQTSKYLNTYEFDTPNKDLIVENIKNNF